MIVMNKFISFGKGVLKAILRIFTPKIITNCQYIKVKYKNQHTFFGYYDINPFNNEKLLFITISKEKKAYIGIYNIISKKKEILVQTKSWNWQQGCRLRWETDDSILYNDFVDNRYVTKRYILSTRKTQIIGRAMYDICIKKKYGLALDFNRLGYKRPGYGYTNLPFEGEIGLENKGIDYVDIKTGFTKKILTYPEIACVANEDNPDYSSNYINHISISPDGSSFIFFWLSTKENGFHAKLMHYDIEECKLKCLEEEHRVSHYCWVNSETLLISVVKEDYSVAYYLYNHNKKKLVFMENILDFDGHPTFLEEGRYLIDSYPDEHNYQQLYIVNTYENSLIRIADVYHTKDHCGEFRCDLHPRINETNEWLCIDTDMSKVRQLFVLVLRNELL